MVNYFRFHHLCCRYEGRRARPSHSERGHQAMGADKEEEQPAPWTRVASLAFSQRNNNGLAHSTLAVLNYNALSSKAVGNTEKALGNAPKLLLPHPGGKKAGRGPARLAASTHQCSCAKCSTSAPTAQPQYIQMPPPCMRCGPPVYAQPQQMTYMPQQMTHMPQQVVYMPQQSLQQSQYYQRVQQAPPPGYGWVGGGYPVYM